MTEPVHDGVPAPRGTAVERLRTAGKGALMGVADLVPGVSGGTVALVVGIHPRLVAAIAAWDIRLPRDLWHALRGDGEARTAARADLHRLDLGFLLPLGAGLLGAIALGITGVSHAIEAFPGPAMALFAGLIAASVPLPWRRIERPAGPAWGLFVAGAAVTAALTFIPGAALPLVWWAMLLAGFIAVNALLLPGISGAGLLVILGVYAPVIDAAAHLDWRLLVPFVAGGVLGLMVASRALRHLFAHHSDATYALLTGLLAGSVLRVWPWRSQPGFSEGVPVLPADFPDALLLLGVALMGALLVVMLDRLARGPVAKDR